MNDVKKISPVGSIHGWEESEFGEFVLSEDYDALEAEAQALRDQVKALQSDANSYQAGYDEGRRMGTKHRQSEVEQLMREVEALRARVAELEAEVEDADGLSKRLGELLSEITIIIRGPEPELTRWGYSDLPLRVKAVVEEVAALRARVVVLPSVDSVMNIVMRYQWNEKTNVTGTTNWAANLGMKVVDEVKRLNGKVVSEGLLRRIVAEPVGGAVYDAIAELRAMLGEGKDP
ncbi:hypothetical protein A9C11_10770 [Pseudomonas citronellolis]|uniref:Uncharacterized protein n=1 Tax=Pseudomonas citronellolis TaxID=53408 RepID=A0A1A9K9H7_9PSED|nr:hypothetical protein [Pseudomonas citronellolis]ANI14436.1 hypothetical protein A9C11_10770 [Pseudomonas citronellolis]